jgi:hypothetical protein
VVLQWHDAVTGVTVRRVVTRRMSVVGTLGEFLRGVNPQVRGSRFEGLRGLNPQISGAKTLQP